MNLEQAQSAKTSALLLTLNRQWQRALWHINRSPAKHVVKATLRSLRRNELALRRQLLNELPCNANIVQAAKQLQQEGWCEVTGLINGQLLQALSEAGTQKLLRAAQGDVREASRHKFFWTRLLDEDMVDGKLPIDNPCVRFALQPQLVAVIAHALQELPRLDAVLLTLSQETQSELAYSQLWHRDHDDVRTIKLFTYLTEVTSRDDGPFTFVLGPASDRFGFSLKSHQPDARVLPRLAPGDVKEMLAPRLTSFMVETSRCLHMGSRMAPGHARLLYTATFFSSPRIYPEPPARFLLNSNEDRLTHLLAGRPD